MRLVALISGGKDSIYNMLQCVAADHEIVAVANIEPETKEELDSYMYQSVGHEVVSLIGLALALPIYRQKTKGKALCKSKTYVETNQDEVEDLFKLLQKVKNEMHIEGVSVGAIASDYQRTRVENVCARLGLKCFAYLWRRNQSELLEEMIDANLDAIIIKVASIGLNPDKHLGMHIRDMKLYLMDVNKKYGVNVCGEGGEYETLTIDCPLFHRNINITESEKILLSNDAFAPVGFLNVKNAVLNPKVWGTDDPVLSLRTRLANVKSMVKGPYNFIEDCVDEISLNIFPQQKTVPAEVLPFPFEPNQNEVPKNVKEYWKKTPSSIQQPHTSQKLALGPSRIVPLHKTTSNLNYSTGWCSIGNVTGLNVYDAFRCLLAQLDRMKYELRDLVFVNVFLRDIREFNCMNKIYSRYMPELFPPARVCVATELPPEVNILIMVVAHKYLSKSQKALSTNCDPVREVMHVQSISHWAPANIGPYSQCVKVRGLYYLSGQIPLIPGTMEILNKPISLQCKLALRHVKRILQSMNEHLNVYNIFQAICYVTSEKIASDVPALWSYFTNNSTAALAVVVVTGLPKNAQLEWEIVACEYENPQVCEDLETIDNYTIRMKRCSYFEPYCSSFICRVHIGKMANASGKPIVPEVFEIVLKHCLGFIRKEVKNMGKHFCTMKLFYKSNFFKSGNLITEFLLSFSFENKIVVTGIPVLAFREPEVFLTITGLCY